MPKCATWHQDTGNCPGVRFSISAGRAHPTQLV